MQERIKSRQQAIGSVALACHKVGISPSYFAFSNNVEATSVIPSANLDEIGRCFVLGAKHSRILFTPSELDLCAANLVAMCFDPRRNFVAGQRRLSVHNEKLAADYYLFT